MANFAIKPGAGVMRDVINGDNPLSPSNLKNVVFDAFGLKVHGMTMQGVVPWASFGSPVYYQLTYPNTHLSNAYWLLDIVFPEPLTYCPIVLVQFQTAAGVWTPSYEYSETGGGAYTVTTGFATSLTKLTLYAGSTGVGASASALPLAASYRLFGV